MNNNIDNKTNEKNNNICGNDGLKDILLTLGFVVVATIAIIIIAHYSG